jgi:hypothetical protein
LPSNLVSPFFSTFCVLFQIVLPRAITLRVFLSALVFLANGGVTRRALLSFFTF